MSGELIKLIIGVKKSCQKKEEEIRKGLGLSSAEYSALAALPTTGSLTCQQASETMNLSPSRAGRVINGMVEKGLIDRSTGEEDRRVNNIELTEQGRGAKKKIDSFLAECEEKIISRLESGDLESARTGLKLVLAAMENSAESAPLH